MLDKKLIYDHFVLFEGKVPHFYLDGESIVTIGVGCVVDNVRALPMSRDKDGSDATLSEISSEYALIARCVAGQKVSYYKDICRLHITEETIEKLFTSKLNGFIQFINSQICNLDELAPAAQLVILDMVFNLGGMGLKTKFPIFMHAFLAKNWLLAAEASVRNGISLDRNKWTFEALKSLDLVAGEN